MVRFGPLVKAVSGLLAFRSSLGVRIEPLWKVIGDV